MQQTLSPDLTSPLSREAQSKRSPIFPESWKVRSNALSKQKGPCESKVFVARIHLKIKFGSRSYLSHGSFIDVQAKCFFAKHRDISQPSARLPFSPARNVASHSTFHGEVKFEDTPRENYHGILKQKCDPPSIVLDESNSGF